MQKGDENRRPEELSGLARLAHAELKRRGKSEGEIEDAVEERLEDDDE